MLECRPMHAILLFCFSILSFSALAAPPGSALASAAEQFLQAQAQGLPGKVVVSVGTIEESSRFPPCGAPEIALAPASRAWGHTKLVIRCQTPVPWQQYVAARVSLMGLFPVAAYPLPQGHLLAESDLTSKSGDLTEFPPNIITSPQQALGKTLLMPVATGQPLRNDLLKQPLVLQPGQNVKVISRGPGFQVASEGQALTGATDGQIVRVRMPNGQTLSGVARGGGIVEISH